MEDAAFDGLRSKRLVLRRFAPGDAAALAAYRSEPDVARYQDWDAPYPVDEAQAFIASLDGLAPGTPGTWFQFAVCLASGGPLIGDCALRTTRDARQGELGFTFATAHQGQGYAAEAVRAVVAYAFDRLGLHRVFARTDLGNLRAQRLLERLGFRREAELLESTWFKGGWATDLLYARLARECRAEREAFVAAVRAGDSATVARALAADPPLARARDGAGVSLVCLAVYLGREELAALLAAERNDLDVFEASTLGDAARVAELLRDDPGSIDAISPDGFHPLGYACFFGREEVFDVLLARGANVEAPAANAMRVRPLHSALAHADPGVALRLARRLLEAGASANVAQQKGLTPLHEAVLRGHPELVRLLLAHGADPGARNEDGQSPAAIARERGDERIAKLLAGARGFAQR